MKKSAAAIAALFVLMQGAALPANADDTLHPDVEYALSEVPGGTVIDAYTVVWPETGMTLTVGDASGPSVSAVGGCATGQYCAFSGTGLTGTKLSWSVCTTVSTAALSAARSFANARSSGTVQARNSTGTVLATASANSWLNVSTATASLRCLL